MYIKKHIKTSHLFLILAIVLTMLFTICTQESYAATSSTSKNYYTKTWNLQSATWQDPQNVMVMWKSYKGYKYQVYRSNEKDGEYTMIGTTSANSYRDEDVKYPNTYYYKVIPVKSGKTFKESNPVESKVNSKKISKVTVLMYHDFISEKDIKNGVTFGDYALAPADFEKDLKYFRKNGYTTITSKDLLSYINNKKVLPAKALIISIDDGTQGVYTNCWPLLKKYNMKADFNLIGKNIDKAWNKVHKGGTRLGESAPYCVWEELIKMSKSGVINLCSHTYALHYYDRNGRKGANLMKGESIEDYIALIKSDYKLAVSSMTGWTGLSIKTMAYPYSRRCKETDKALLENTGYEILMAGDGARGTRANYFVNGAAAQSQMRLMSRPCRMDGHPASEYLDDVNKEDAANGVNNAENTLVLTKTQCTKIAKAYKIYSDVKTNASYAGAVYYCYVNKLLPGTTLTQFSPNKVVTPKTAKKLLSGLDGISVPKKNVTRAQLAVLIQNWGTKKYKN